MNNSIQPYTKPASSSYM